MRFVLSFPIILIKAQHGTIIFSLLPLPRRLPYLQPTQTRGKLSFLSLLAVESNIKVSHAALLFLNVFIMHFTLGIFVSIPVLVIIRNIRFESSC